MSRYTFYDNDAYFMDQLDYDYEPTVVRKYSPSLNSPPPVPTLPYEFVKKTYIPRRQYQQPQPVLYQPNQTRRPSADYLMTEQYPNYSSNQPIQPNSLYAQTFENHERDRSNSVESGDDLVKRKSTRVGATRYCCGCFSTRKRCILVIGLLLIILILSGILGFVLFPRTPTIALTAPSTINGLEMSPDPVVSFLQATKEKPFVATLQMGIQVNVESQNIVSATFDDLIINAQLLDPDGSGRLVQGRLGKGELGQLRVNSKSSTVVQVPFSLVFRLDKPMRSIVDDPQVLSLVRSCQPQLFPGLPPARNIGQIGLRIEGYVKNRFVDWTGQPQRINRDMFFPCSASTLEMALMIQKCINETQK